MKTFIFILIVLLILFIVFKLFRKKKIIEEDTIHEAWVSKKKASERISSNIISDKKYASNKIEIPESVKSEKLIDIINQGNKALSDMDRLRNTISNESVIQQINCIIDITKKIMKDAIDDPNDIPQIKRFFNYYLPTTIKLLNSYEKLENNNISSDSIIKTKENIEQMLDVAIKAYNKRLDSLFENQAIDIETDIDVMNQLLEQEGLIKTQKLQTMEGNNTNG